MNGKIENVLEKNPPFALRAPTQAKSGAYPGFFLICMGFLRKNPKIPPSKNFWQLPLQKLKTQFMPNFNSNYTDNNKVTLKSIRFLILFPNF